MLAFNAFPTIGLDLVLGTKTGERIDQQRFVSAGVHERVAPLGVGQFMDEGLVGLAQLAINLPQLSVVEGRRAHRSETSNSKAMRAP